jgi:membrane protein YdbS with pleckstrin-like domain
VISDADSPSRAEIDLFWAGYSGWAFVPRAIAYAICCVLAFSFGPSLFALLGIDRDWGSVILFQTALAVGAIIAGVAFYRGAGYVYRLTPTRVYVDFGALSYPTQPIELARIEKIDVLILPLMAWFDVGTIVIREAGRKPIKLRGILRPQALANLIREVSKLSGDPSK